MKRYLFLVLFLAIAFASVKVGAGEKIPAPVGWVNDFAGVIDYEYKNKIETVIEETERTTTAEMTVATFKSIAPYDEASYARLVFDNWKIGKKGKDNGVLILIAIDEHRWRIEVGYGLERILTDGLCGQIGRDYMVPYFRRGKYGEGLYNAVAAIAKIIAQDAHANLRSLEGVKIKKRSEEGPLFMSLVYLFILIFFFLWNLPWPFIIGLPFTLLFALGLFQVSPILGILVIIGYIASLIVRYNYWSKLPPDKRKSFFGTQDYGGTFSGGGGGGFGGGGFGGFGGGGGGGGGAGGGW